MSGKERSSFHYEHAHKTWLPPGFGSDVGDGLDLLRHPWQLFDVFYFHSINACASRTSLVERVIVACMVITTSLAIIRVVAQPAAVRHVVPFREHATVTRKMGDATARITRQEQSATAVRMGTMEWSSMTYLGAKVSEVIHARMRYDLRYDMALRHTLFAHQKRCIQVFYATWSVSFVFSFIMIQSQSVR